MDLTYLDNIGCVRRHGPLGGDLIALGEAITGKSVELSELGATIAYDLSVESRSHLSKR